MGLSPILQSRTLTRRLRRIEPESAVHSFVLPLGIPPATHLPYPPAQPPRSRGVLPCQRPDCPCPDSVESTRVLCRPLALPEIALSGRLLATSRPRQEPEYQARPCHPHGPHAKPSSHAGP